MEVSHLPPAHIPQTPPTIWADNDTCCTFPWTMTEMRPRATQWMSVHRIKTSTCTLPQHCSKPAISERARDSTASRQADKNEEVFLKCLYRLKMGKGENIISLTSTHLVYDLRQDVNQFTHDEGRSRDTQLYWVLSQETCDSFWSQIPFCQWTQSWRER